MTKEQLTAEIKNLDEIAVRCASNTACFRAVCNAIETLQSERNRN